MRPTWLERKRWLLLTQGLAHALLQPAIFVGCTFLLGPYTSVWGVVFNFTIALIGAGLIGLAVVGYRRHRLRMRAVALMLAVNGHTREELWDLLTNDIIDYATFARLFHA